MKNKNYNFKGIFAIILIGITLFSCKKDISQIGVDIVGGKPLKVLYTDTTSVQIFSVLRDSVRTDELTSNPIGVIVDPIFGTTKSSLAIQYNLSLLTFSFGENPVFDSLVLSMPYQKTSPYGDTLAPLKFRIYELDELLDYDTAYYSNRKAKYLPQLLGEVNVIPRPLDSVLVDSKKTAPHLRLKLSPQLGQRLMSYNDTIYYNNDDFIERFKGLYFEPVYTSGVGNLTFFNMYSALSKLTIYYKNDVADSLSYDFGVSAYSPSFQNFDHLDYVGAHPDFYKQVVQKDTTLGAEKFYLQTLGGVDAYIRFPNLFKRTDYSKFAVNEAKLVITNIEPDNIFVHPDNMFLFQSRYSTADSTSSYYYIEDASAGGTYFNGYYNKTLKQYEFRITKYVQDYISGKYDSDHMLMQIMGATYKGARLVGGGSNPASNPQSRARLEIIYTEIDTTIP